MTNTQANWPSLVALAEQCTGFTETIKLDRMLQKQFAAPPAELATKPVRMAVLGSASVDHLLPGLRVAALRRGIWLTTYTAGYGQYLQELLDTKSGLHAFKPNTVLFAFDAAHILGAPALSQEAGAVLDAACATLENVWRLARERFGAQLIQQTLMPVFPSLMGNNEHRLPTSPRRMVFALNERLRSCVDAHGVDILALDDRIMSDGIDAWHNPNLWHMAKQEISPAAAPLYGDLVARMLAAAQGRSYKCLVLDLDNTLWGGVIGDDGLEGIVLGQGNALGEAYLSMQRYAHQLSQRGIILAVCSKNDEANALAPFERHPEMILKRSDIACFIANWQDKPSNLREIAQRLNIGLDALVFADDNPFERNLVRSELPMVAVPELPEDPALYAHTIAAGGYFESLGLTPEDRERSQQYQANLQCETLKASTTDIGEYLRNLGMKLHWQPFDNIGLQRVVQLINKTNQFNLTTRRYNENDVLMLMNDPCAFTLQLRLTDRFGDNGIIGVVIGKMDAGSDMRIDTWLMSCRVLGRHAEEATLNLVVAQAQRLGAKRLIGEYRPTAKNGMVKDHYAKLGFSPLDAGDDGATQWVLAVSEYMPHNTAITAKAVTHG